MSGDAVVGSSDAWERLSTAFVTVLAAPPAERERLMTRLSGTDTRFHAELVSLVAASDGAPAFLTTFRSSVIEPALEQGSVVDAGVDSLDAETPSVTTGSRIRHVVVHERIGSGGAGLVYRGHDTLLARDVAIKVLHPRLRDDVAARDRLLSEARALSRLDDPHVCPIHAVEAMDDGSVCLVMGFCAGGTLRDRLRLRPWPTEALLPLARAVARGLAHAHRLGIVHGDVKPANIGFGDDDLPRLLDFGIAIRLDEPRLGGHVRGGTLPYLAPEVWRGEAVTPRSDVWALGVTLAEVVLGRRPFGGTTPAELAERIARAELPPLVRPDGTAIPPSLQRAIATMLAADPAGRPRDGTAAAALLDTVQLAPPRWRSRTIVAGAALAVAGAGLALSLGRPRPPDAATTETSIAVAPVGTALPTLAVLPFTIRGPASIAYLTDGMVDVLAPAFDATGLVRGVDPGAVLGALHGRALDSATAQRVARTVQADRYVVGSIVSGGQSLLVRAVLHRANGAEVGRASVTARGIADLPMAAAALVRQLIASDLVAPGDTIASVAAATTRSTTALRAYLDGERALRDARPVAAMEYFQSAVRADSAFALAWYRLARAARWSAVDSVRRKAIAMAARLAAALPSRQQRIVQAQASLHTGRPSVLEREIRQLVAEYPTDVDAWMLLGELQVSNNPFIGRPIADAAAAFDRVMTLDPRHREVTVHLMDLAALAGRRPQLDTLYTMYFRPNSAGEQPGIRAAYTALHRRLVGASGAAGRALGPTDDPLLARIAIERMRVGLLDVADARAWATLMSGASETRLDGLLALATLATADGNWPVAAAQLDTAARLDAGRAAELRAVLVLAPSVLVADTAIAGARRALRAADGQGGRDPAGLADADRARIRLHLDGLLSIRLRDERRVAQVREALGTRVAGEGLLGSALRASLDAHRAFERGDWTQASAAFAAAAIDLPPRLRTAHPALAQSLDRYRRAEIAARVGDPADASRWRATLRESRGLGDLPFQRRRRSGDAEP